MLIVEAYTTLQKEAYTVRGADRVGNSETKIKAKTLQLIFYFAKNRFF